VGYQPQLLEYMDQTVYSRQRLITFSHERDDEMVAVSCMKEFPVDHLNVIHGPQK